MKHFIVIGMLMLIIALCVTVIVWLIFQDAVSTQVEEVTPAPVDGDGILLFDVLPAQTE